MALWFIWFGVDIIIFLSRAAQGEIKKQMIGFLVGNIFLIASVKIEGWKLDLFDKIAIAAASGGMVL